jgi:dTDP-glucose 4,6-dehydratase
MNLLVTGGLGFIGSNFIRLVLEERPDWGIVNYDAVTYAGNPANLSDVEDSPKYTFVRGDIADDKAVADLFGKNGPFDMVVNFAAETHVDRSLHQSAVFVRTNVVGTEVLLRASMEGKVGRFLQISTDEVYGSTPEGKRFTEADPLEPSSPYSASKAGADLTVLAFGHSFGLPVVITRSSNNYGPYQYPEKLLPLFITNLMAGTQVPVYGDGLQVRNWLYVEDNCRGVLAVLEKGADGQVYNVGSENEVANLDMTKALIAAMGKGEDAITYVTDRPGHDRRYALDSSKLTGELGWKPAVSLEEGMKRTVEWYTANRSWWEPLKQKSYEPWKSW